MAALCAGAGARSLPLPSEGTKAEASPLVRRAVSGNDVGVAGGIVWYGEREQAEALAQIDRLGIRWVRQDISWGAHERRPGVFDWTRGDRLFRNTALVGVSVLGVLGYSAEWAASGPTIYHPPSDPGTYASFCREVVRRYGPGGTFWRANPGLPYRPLRAVELWNEPWHANFWRPVPDPAAYARLASAAAKAIRAVQPDVKILVSADVFQGRKDTRESLDWFGPLLEAAPRFLRDEVDAYSVHLYTQSRSPADSVTPQRWRFDRLLITRELAARAGASHPIWITEFGWNSSAGHRDGVSEETQAAYTIVALRRAFREWGGFVERAFLYRWGRSGGDYEGGWALARPDGTPKPVVDSLASLLG
jgi:hypothetical protein